MALYALSQRTVNNSTATCAWEIRSTAGNKPKVLQMEMTQNAAGTSPNVYGIGRPGVIGVTPTTPQTFVDENDGNAPTGLTTAAVAWGTAPTVPANFNRRYSLTNTAGSGFIGLFPAGFGIPVSNSVIIWIINNGAVGDASAIVSE